MMNFLQYLHERWTTYLFMAAVFLFALIVYKLDVGFNITPSNACYIGLGWLILLVVYAGVDYGILKYRVSKLNDYIRFNALLEPSEHFIYPLDKKHAVLFHNLAVEYERYKSEICTKSSQQLEFVTKWLHDVKVPIAAARLVLDQHESEIPAGFYQSFDQELFFIEEAMEKVFYQIKAGSLYEDYKITKVTTKHLIAAALKGYSNFFGYKCLEIRLVGDSYQVLTDEKWSSYILSQIISNAVKYTSIGGQVQIITERNGDETTIAIKNSGQGISPQDIGQVFNRGYTSSDNRGGGKATGYGLYLAKKLSDKLGHKLTVQSEYGKYALFALTFSEAPTLHQVTKMLEDKPKL